MASIIIPSNQALPPLKTQEPAPRPMLTPGMWAWSTVERLMSGRSTNNNGGKDAEPRY
jgi:hypothetical protein